jgi:integrase
MTATPRLNDELAVSCIRTDDDIVLVSMPLRDGADRATLSRFGEDVWDMAPAMFNMARKAFRTVDFSVILCAAERLLAKEYIYAWMNERLADGEPRLRPVSGHTALATLRRFLDFVRSRIGRLDLAAVDQDLIDAYAAHHRARPITAGRVGVCLRPIVQLHRLAPYLTCGGLTFAPWRGRPVYRATGQGARSSENRTARIPEPVIGAMLRWSIKYIEHFADDIFTAQAELDALNTRFSARSRQRHTRPTVVLESWIDKRRREGRGIPVWEKPLSIGGVTGRLSRDGKFDGNVINLKFVTMQCGLHLTTVFKDPALLSMIHGAADELGFEVGGMDTPISPDPDTGQPWRERFDAISLAREERHLQTAAYILCSYLTGMRDGEVQSLQAGCLKRSLGRDGQTERLAIEGVTWKDRGARGEQVDWITIEPAVHAIRVAERLSERFRRSAVTERLWLALDDRETNNAETPILIAKKINQFREHLDERYGANDCPAIPRVGEEVWRFNTRQFRRTLAWYIANRPFGVVAGKIQYKHASVAMFDGYAGSSASGFRQEVEQELALGQLDDIIDYFENRRRGRRPGGPASRRIGAELERVGRELRPLPGQLADRKRLKAMLAHLARTLHVGYLNDCFFDPSAALCLREAEKPSASAPVLSRCAPDRCPNACLVERHRPPWEASIAQAEELLADKRLSPLQREALRSDNERKRRLIAPLKGCTS